MENIVLELNNVTKMYGSKTALENVSIQLKTGRIIGLLGPNGSGKTTMLKTILHIIRQQEGSIKICGENVSYETRKFISFMPDREFLFDYMKTTDAIKYYQDLFSDFDIELSNKLCSKLGIDKDMNINKMSKGNKEKVVLMLTLSRKVPIYLLDEPLGSLDPLVKHDMLEVIKEFKDDNKLILISTHLIKDTESILDEVVLLNEGHVGAHTVTSEITNNGKSIEDYYVEVFRGA